MYQYICNKKYKLENSSSLFVNGNKNPQEISQLSYLASKL